ncbi:cytochrome c family protein [Devosia sp.]|uniref:c-type cytochrome n=1 Tax=Devosia sp. TaxID=1871048 RepID=UPI0032667C21
MDSFELNKIIGAVLGTLLFVMGVGIVAESVYKPLEDRGPGYALPEPVAVADAGAAPAKAEVPLAVLLASADATKGQADVKKCQSCHNFGKGEGNKTGPLLYGVVDRMPASHEGFQYSEGMTEHKTKGENWTYERLNAFLTSPKTYTPGTKMNFPGVKDPAERADILAYLQTLSDAPVPFPAPDAAAAAAPAAATTPAATPAAAATTPAATPVAAPAAGAATTAPAATDAAAPAATPVTTTK